MIEHFHFLRPFWLAALPIAGLCLWLVWRLGISRSSWEQWCDPALLTELLVGTRGRADWLPLLGLGLIWLLATIALAGPVWQQQPQPAYSQLHPRVIAFDLSQSMNSADLAPNRLTRARFKLLDLVAGAVGREQGLIVFAGDAFVVSPITDDVETLTNLIPSLNTTTVPTQGSRVDKALSLAHNLLNSMAAPTGEVIVITDGFDQSQRNATFAAAQKLSRAGYELSVLGVGTWEGAPVTLESGSLLVDQSGDIVVPGLDTTSLTALARSGGGKFLQLSSDRRDVEQLNQPREPTAELQWRTEGLSGREISSWYDQGVWLLLPMVLILSLGFRRGWILLLVIVVTPVPQPAYAFQWQDLWQRPDQRAARALTENTPEAVPENADRHWQAAAAYRQQDFPRATEFYSGPKTAVDFYNQGNALAMSGGLDDAINAYQQALELDPDFEDAAFNLEQVKALKQQQQSQQQSGDSSEQSEEQSEDSDSQQSQSNSDDDSQSEQSDSSSDSSQSASSDPESESESQQQSQQQQAEAAEQSESEQAEEKQQQLAEQSDSSEQEQEDESSQPMSAEQLSEAEQQQALQQWLKQVPDDPGGLLRRKFHFQFSQREDTVQENQQW